MLGQGGMGAVYEGWDARLRLRCAIKENRRGRYFPKLVAGRHAPRLRLDGGRQRANLRHEQRRLGPDGTGKRVSSRMAAVRGWTISL